MPGLLQRIKFLLTGMAVWGDNPPVKEDLRTRWAIAGIHSYNWSWVRRWGKQDCGCTINPLTRRTVLYNFNCVNNRLEEDGNAKGQ